MMQTSSQPVPLSGADRAAIMVMLLGEDDAARILSFLTPGELQQLGAKMCAMGEVDYSAIGDAIANFSDSTQSTGISDHGRVDSVRRMMTGAVGEMKADNLMRRLAPDATQVTSPTLEIMRWLDADILAELLAEEHPQAIAVLLLQLDADTAAAALAALREDLHAPVLHRIAKLGPVSRHAITILEDTLSEKIEKLHGSIPLTMGGIKQAAEIINKSHRSIEKRVMPTLNKRDKQLAREIEKEMFKFEHLLVLDTKATGVLLREVDNDTLIDAMRGLEEDQREQFYNAMSSRAADTLRDEIDSRPRIRRADVEAAQAAIVTVAKRLIEDGAIIMGDGDDEYV